MCQHPQQAKPPRSRQLRHRMHQLRLKRRLLSKKKKQKFLQLASLQLPSHSPTALMSRLMNLKMKSPSHVYQTKRLTSTLVCLAVSYKSMSFRTISQKKSSMRSQMPRTVTCSMVAAWLELSKEKVVHRSLKSLDSM